VLPSILLVIAEKGETHGYELASELETLNPEARIEPGAVYRGLRRLEEEAYIVSRWDTEGGGPARRLYSLTEKGQSLLASYNKALEQRIVILQGLLKRLKNLPPG
jgi:poly-beta-hydroxybutyrate-responsive repressor